MSQKRNGLGRNLSALLSQPVVQINSSTPMEAQAHIEYLPIAILNPGQYQPRRTFAAETIDELANSIRQQGLLQPLTVRKATAGHYEIIAGERRWRACQQLQMSHVPVIVRQVNDETAIALALVENLQREDLNVLDQARAMQQLLTDFDLSHQQIAELLSKSRAAVSNHLRLLNLSSEVQVFLEKGSLDMGHARSLLTLSESDQKRIAHMVIKKGLSVRETERLVNARKIKEAIPKSTRNVHSESLQSQITKLGQHLNTEVRIKVKSAEQGSLVIKYSDLNVLDKIMAKILG